MKKGIIAAAAIVVVGMTSVSTSVNANPASQQIIISQDDVQYTIIKTDELPAAVNKSLKEGYSDYTVDQAYKGSDGSYKVDLSKATEKVSVYFNADGKFLKIEQAAKEDTTK